MIIAWIFGVSFGLIGGFGIKNEVDYKNCLKTEAKEKCELIYHSKK